MRRSDLVWLLGFPLYVVLGTLRHELAHAAVAVAQGATITEFVILPSVVDGRFLWGYVDWTGGQVTWLATAAPYFLDAATVAVAAAIVRSVALPRWAWANLVILGLVSPLIDSAYQYVIGLRGGGDVGALLVELPGPVVHAWFSSAIAVFGVLTLVALRAGPAAADPPERPPRTVLDRDLPLRH